MLDETAVKRVMAAVLSVDPATIDQNTRMETVSSWDSLRQMNMILALEDEFGVMFADEDAENLTSYPLICVVLKDLLAGR